MFVFRTKKLRRISQLLLLLAGVAFAPSSSQALSIAEIDGGTLDTLTGSLVGSLSDTFDFRPEVSGGDGVVTTQVFVGTGAAEGNFVYVYQIELFSTPPASVGSVWGMRWFFDEMPVDIPGVGESFFVGDDAGSLDPMIASWVDGVVSFVFIPAITNGTLSHAFGLVSPNAPVEAIAELIDSGAEGGTVSVLSNGISPVPEPSAALMFGVGLLIAASAVARTRS